MSIRNMFCAVFVAFCVVMPFGQLAKAESLCSGSTERYIVRMERASEWFDEVKSIVISEGMSPLWLYLMLSESGGDKNAASKHGAVGPWQLTSLIAKSFGCDDRTDPVKSTMAALKYIKKLSKDFKGDMHKIVQAYNMGGTNLKRIGKPTKEAKALADLVICLFELDPLKLK